MLLGHASHADGAPRARDLRFVRREERSVLEGRPAAAAGVVLPVAADHRLVFPNLEKNREIFDLFLGKFTQ